MPSTVTHSYFIMDIYDRLPIKRKIFLKENKENLKVFAQSTDPLNFYFSLNLKKGAKVRNFAYYFHTHKTREFLITLTNYIKYNYYTNRPEVIAYLYAMISHYVMDSTIHPYVYYKTGQFRKNDRETYKYNGKHHEFETAIDKYLIKIRENILPYKYKHYKYSFNIDSMSKELKEVINFSYKEAFNISKMNTVMLKSIKNMKLAFKVLRYDPWGIKSNIYQMIDKITSSRALKIKFASYHYTIKDIDYLNNEHKTWYNPTTKRKKYNSSFIDLYILSLEKALNIIKNIDLYLYEDKKINLEKLFGNVSYATGVDLDKNQELKYFEF